MTNEDYRKMRGTDKPLNRDEAKIKKWWYELNRKAIDSRRKRDKAILKGRMRNISDQDPDPYEMEEE